jgi:glycosyltransferase involved in cell wall biosynthesis
MKIMHTEASCGFGGQELRILTEAKGLQDRGHDLTIICEAHSNIFKLADSYGLTAIPMPIEKKNRKGFWALRSWIKQNQPDIINTHSSADTWMTAVAVKTLINGSAVIRTRHISAPIPQNLFSRWLYCRGSNFVVTTGEKLREVLVDENGFPENHIKSIRTGIDLNRFKPADKLKRRELLGIKSDVLTLGIVATLRSWKGHRYLLEAFSQLVGDFPIQLLIVGDGPQDESLKFYAEELGVTGSVVFAGRQENVENWMQAMDIFCLPSYANEGVPQSLMQAQACGLPVITTAVGSIEEAVVQNETALIVKPKDVRSLKIAMEFMLADTKKCKQMSRAAEVYAHKNFSLEVMLDEMETLFYSFCKPAR